MNRRQIVLLLIAVVAVLMGSCTQERQPCVEPRTVSLRLGTYQTIVFDSATVHTRQIVDTILPAPVLQQIDTEAKTILYYGAISQGNKFALLLSSVSDSCKWRILEDTSRGPNSSNPLPYDTLTFFYDRKLTFLSNACGYSYYYNLKKVNTTYHNVDSVIISNAGITNNVNVEHLKVYIQRVQ